MKTEELVSVLSNNTEPVDRRLVGRTVNIALATGVAVAVGLTIAGLGIRPDLDTARALTFVFVKLGFTVAVVAVATLYLTRLARPGGERRISPMVAASPFVIIMLLATVNLAMAPRSHWDQMIVGDEWLECLLSVPIIAILPFAAVIWAMRQAAPTDLVRAGAFAGLISGSISAMAYAFHCTEDSLPFVAVWYGGTIVRTFTSA